MGIDAHVLYDCSLTEKEIRGLPQRLEGLNEEIQSLVTEHNSKGSWTLELDEDESGKFYEIAGAWSFGLVINQSQIRLWHWARWKWIISQECYDEEFFSIARLIGKTIGAKRAIYLSDYLADEFDESTSFEEYCSELNSPGDIKKKYEIKEGYWNVYFYEAI